MSALLKNEPQNEPKQAPEPEAEELETFGVAGPILIFTFLLWGVTMAAAAAAVS